MARSLIVRATLIAALLSAQGCCSVFALFGCGTGVPLVPVGWDSPEQGLRTFLAAIRASDVKVIYQSLGESLKERRDLDAMKLAIAWKKLQEQAPGLHLAGDAGVLETERSTSRWRYLLESHGYRFAVDLVPQPYWEVGRWGPDRNEVLTLGEFAGSVDDVIDAVDPNKSRVVVRIDDDALFGIARDAIAFVKVGLEWKIDDLRRVGEDAATNRKQQQE